ncbi:hypothetical protein BpHYR1_021215 [Brachionus plicatilis]|uniref:Uncharacterized protein n=1 Tax=Brachionus plicatilis TaxID=10195 RepID=A0A3M7T368_BRAPC|nr:hypothetical protein BpHYR1_021215 [Brachionus plicatilis]
MAALSARSRRSGENKMSGKKRMSVASSMLSSFIDLRKQMVFSNTSSLQIRRKKSSCMLAPPDAGLSSRSRLIKLSNLLAWASYSDDDEQMAVGAHAHAVHAELVELSGGGGGTRRARLLVAVRALGHGPVRLALRLPALRFGRWCRRRRLLGLVLAPVAVLLVPLVVRQHPLGPHAHRQTRFVAAKLADFARVRVHFALARIRALVVLEAVLLDGTAKERLARLARYAAEVRARRLVAAHVTLALVHVLLLLLLVVLLVLLLVLAEVGAGRVVEQVGGGGGRCGCAGRVRSLAVQRRADEVVDDAAQRAAQLVAGVVAVVAVVVVGVQFEGGARCRPCGRKTTLTLI